MAVRSRERLSRVTAHILFFPGPTSSLRDEQALVGPPPQMGPLPHRGREVARTSFTRDSSHLVFSPGRLRPFGTNRRWSALLHRWGPCPIVAVRSRERLSRVTAHILFFPGPTSSLRDEQALVGPPPQMGPLPHRGREVARTSFTRDSSHLVFSRADFVPSGRTGAGRPSSTDGAPAPSWP